MDLANPIDLARFGVFAGSDLEWIWSSGVPKFLKFSQIMIKVTLYVRYQSQIADLAKSPCQLLESAKSS